jgi:hypothetical protein
VDLPASVQRLLSDYDIPATPSGPGWERVVIERVMARGTLADMRWLLASFDRDRLAAYLAERGRRVLPPRELRFWATICRVPAAEADSWLHAARERERMWRG